MVVVVVVVMVVVVVVVVVVGKLIAGSREVGKLIVGSILGTFIYLIKLKAQLHSLLYVRDQ